MINIVLYEPEIPANTGNIMRTCAAFGCKLHLIEPLGFYVDDAHLRRAGMDYRDRVDMHVYSDWNDFLSQNEGPMYFMTRYGKKAPDAFDFSNEEENLYLVFGKESTGIDKQILVDHLDQCIRVPMLSDTRCINLSNTVAMLVYEVERQRGFKGLSATETIKGEDFLDEILVGK